jgi:hypothetical protein
MAFAHLPYDRPVDRAQFRRRAIALVLAVVVHLLLITLLILQRNQPLPRKADDRLPVTFQMMPTQKEDAGAKQKERKDSRAEAGAPKAPARPSPPKGPVESKPKDEPPLSPFLTMSRDDFAASNIDRLPSRKGERDPGGSGSGALASSGTGNSNVVGPGEGPGGVQLFEAEWYRKPTNAELAGYLPPNAPRRGWGLVACKTIENYHVDNCQTLGESPFGSGLARAVRLAAWQFLVRPPRIDGKPQVGAWVRIRIDYSESSAGDAP